MKTREELNKIGKIILTGNNLYTFLQIVDKILVDQYIHIFERVRRNLEKKEEFVMSVVRDDVKNLFEIKINNFHWFLPVHSASHLIIEE